MNPRCQQPVFMVPPTLWQANVSRCHLCIWWGKFFTPRHWFLNDKNKLSLAGQFLISASPWEQGLWQKLASPWQLHTGRLRAGWTRRMCFSLTSHDVSQMGRAAWGCLQEGYRFLIFSPVNLLLYPIIKSGELE